MDRELKTRNSAAMTDLPPTQLTVLFADICRSTVQFDRLGDQEALNLVMQALAMVTRAVSQQDGTAIGAIGDEVMCTLARFTLAGHSTCRNFAASSPAATAGEPTLN